jgi:hypothetical protein
MKKLLFLSLLSLFVFHAQAQIPSSIKSPDPIVNSPQHLCPFDSLLLSASGSTGNYNWFSDSLGMHFLDSGATFQTGIISCDTIFYVQAYADSGMQTYNFTNCGITGRTGPTQYDVDTAYAGTNLDGDVSITTQGIQEWVIPTTGKYTVEVAGAQAGPYSTSPGYGAILSADIDLISGVTLQIIVGQRGESSHGSYPYGFAGGGGSFVVIEDTIPLIVAGGGGSYFSGASINDVYGQTTNIGGTGGATPNAIGYGGNTLDNSGPGGGFYSDGVGTHGGFAFVNGGLGAYSTEMGYIEGGFGGGGARKGSFGNGCGGGYSGGNGGISTTSWVSGSGGGSYVTPLAENLATSDGAYENSSFFNSELINNTTYNIGPGYVTITLNTVNSPSNIIAIVIKLDSVPEIITQPTNTSVVSSNNASFSVAAQGTNLSYQWQESMNAGVNWTDLTDGGTYSGVTTANLSLSAVPLSMDDYYYRCIVSGNCSPSDTSDEAILSVTATGIEEVGLNTAQIYPNPVSNTLTLELNNADSKQLNVRVYDVLGKQQQEWKETSLTQGHQQLSLDVSRLSKGVYYLRIRLDEEVRDFRFVKE